MILDKGVAWVELDEIRRASLGMNGADIVLALNAAKVAYAQNPEKRGRMVYKGYEAVAALGLPVCPACFGSLNGRSDKTYCSKKCRETMESILRAPACEIALCCDGMEDISVPLDGRMMNKIRKRAGEMRVPVQVAVRALLDAGVRYESKNL